MKLLRLLPIFTAILFVLSSKYSVRITKGEKLTVKINFNIFAIVIYEDKTHKNRLKNLFKSFRRIKGAIRSAKYLISKSDVVIFGSGKITDHILRVYLEANAKRFRYKNTDSFYRSNLQNNGEMDIIASFSLTNLIISALIFLYYTVKAKLKRVIKNV